MNSSHEKVRELRVRTVSAKVLRRFDRVAASILPSELSHSHYQYLTKNTVGTLAIRAGFMGSNFLIAVILARLLGAESYGEYTYILAWISLLSIPATFGFDQLLVRLVATYRVHTNWSLLHGLLRRANQVVLLSSIAIICAAVLALRLVLSSLEGRTAYLLFLALPILPITALTSLQRGTLQGLHQVIRGLTPEMVAEPVVLICFLLLAATLFQDSVQIPLVIIIRVVSTGIALGVGVLLVRRYLPLAITGTAPAYQTTMWLRSTVPLMIVAGLGVLNARIDVFFLGTFRGGAEVGLYSVANRGAGLTPFLLTVVNTPLAPIIASLYADLKLNQLQILLRRTVRLVFLASLPIATGLVVFGKFFLALHGSEFVAGWPLLIVLVFGQMISIIAGPVQLSLIMTGHERTVASAIGLSALLNLTLNALLTPKWGAIGTAFATASSIALWNLALAFWIYRKLGFSTSIA